MEKGKISVWQAGILTLTHPLGTGLFVLPAFAINWAREDAWLIEILVTVPGLVIVFAVMKLGLMFPGQTIVQYSETILGKYFGKLVGLMFVYYFFGIGSIILFQMSSFLSAIVMPETRAIYFIVITGIVILYTVNYGLEVIARLTVWFFPIIVGSLLLIVFLSYKDMNLDHLRPFLADGLKPVLMGSLAPYGWRGTIIVMAMLIPYVNQPQKIKAPFLFALIGMGLLFELNTVSDLAVFGPFEGGRISLPTVHLVKLINVADFIQHIESIMVLIWVGAVYTMSTVWFYCSVLGLAQVLNLKTSRPLLMPMMIVYIAIAYTNYSNYPEFVDFAQRAWPPYAFLHQLLIPVFLLTFAFIRGQGVRQTGPKGKGD